ncbi:ribosome maturation factor RimM [Xanthobacter dioxanivorans]|uniref:Ribosome maturation factor RimM n=1 Tax=Xanthobacter dioxanivorans TaxID=2528964 RepID=A0A974PRR5_9HYPH|nr:ribosome maturation factor RimM [Xanthobacter dioxanivorans]QRG08548.1 ribosome maturation factor RimM [Xanthobacter dioxanivorans]
MAERILVARIGAPHGVRGEVRLFVFTGDPEAVLHYDPLTDASGRAFRITTLRAAKDHFVARLDGVADRTAAEALTNVDLFVPRAALPAPEDEETFYHADLIGLGVEDEAGARIGAVTALHDFGAGDILEYAPALPGIKAKTLMVPFTRDAVPVVDVAGGRVVIAEAFVERRPSAPEDGEDTGAED